MTYLGLLIHIPGKGHGVVSDFFNIANCVEALFVVSCRENRKSQFSYLLKKKTGYFVFWIGFGWQLCTISTRPQLRKPVQTSMHFTYRLILAGVEACTYIRWLNNFREWCANSSGECQRMATLKQCLPKQVDLRLISWVYIKQHPSRLDNSYLFM